MWLPVSLSCVRLIARNTVREAMRQRLTLFFGVLALALVLGVGQFREFNFGASEIKFIADFGFGTMAFFGAALTITATSQLFFSEIEHRTILTLLAKPVTRVDFVLGKFFGVVAITGVFCAALTMLLAAVMWSRESTLMRNFPAVVGPNAHVDYLTVAAVGFAQWIKLIVLSALTLLIASFARTQLFAVVTGFFVLVICHLQFLAQMAAMRSGSALTRGMMQCVSRIFPDFQVFDFSESLATTTGIVWGQLASVSLYGLGYAAIACGLASLSFRTREI